MKKKSLVLAAVAVAVCGLAGVAQAVPISGDITFAGGVELNTASAGTATEVLAWTGPGGSGLPVVISDDGSFSGVAPGTTATFTSPWFFNSGAVASLWSVGGFTFNLTSSKIVFQGGSPAGVLVDGIGAISGNGLSPEAMSWSFSTSDPGATGVDGLVFSFQVADGTTGTSAVPDGGTTAMLLGLGVLGLGLVKKQMFA
jgi:VPDSG-CTERM motif